MENELGRLLELKQQNLHVWVEDARDILQELWGKLYFSEEEISYFTPAHSDVMSDALLSAHEMEIVRLQNLLEERAPIISLIDKHRSFIGDREALAASANDASRLISRGAGGNRDPTRLLREEKMRKRIAKDLPKVEVELKRELEKWEDEYGEPFLVNGEDYLQTLMSISAVCQSRSGGKTPAPTPGRQRSNTAGATSGLTRTLSRPTTSGRPAATARPKTPSAPPLRSKTPIERITLNHSASLSSTIGRSGSRSLGVAAQREAAAFHRSGAKTPSAGTGGRIGISNSTSTSNLHRSPSKSSMRENNPPDRSANVKETQTIGRFSSSKRKPAPLSNIMGPPKMQPLSRPSSKDAQTPGRTFQMQEREKDRAASEISIRSVSPEERSYEEDDGADRHMTRAKHQYPSSRQNAPHSTQREVSEDSSNASMASRKYSMTSSATLASGSGSENWETFGAESEFGDADEERVDPREGYYRNKIGGYGAYAGDTNGGRGGGGVVMVRSEDEWMDDEGCF